MNRVILDPKEQGETVFRPVQGFDFTPVLAAGETISTATIFSWVYTGVDSNPISIISGSPIVSGSVVKQLFTGGQIGTIYGVNCQVVTSLGQTISLPAYLAVVRIPE